MASSSEKLLLLLLRQGSCSRADLAKSMHLSRPAVSSLVDGLIRQGILRESGCGVSSGGKPPILLTLEPDRFASIGIDIGHESLLRGVLCNAAGTPVVTREITHDNRFETILEQAARLVGELKDAAAAPVCGVGAAIAGQIDHASNEIVYCANFPLKRRNFAGSAGKPGAHRRFMGILFRRGRTDGGLHLHLGRARHRHRHLPGRTAAAGALRCGGGNPHVVRPLPRRAFPAADRAGDERKVSA